MKFEEVLAQIEAAVRQHGAALEDLTARFRNGAISRDEFAAEMAALRTRFEKIVQELTREAKSAAFVAMASLNVPESEPKD
jgi:hypothetical protein